MRELLTIQGELHLPGVFMHDKHLEEIERQLCDYGLMPVQARERRWRLDHESPGGYVLSFRFPLPETS